MYSITIVGNIGFTKNILDDNDIFAVYYNFRINIDFIEFYFSKFLLSHSQYISMEKHIENNSSYLDNLKVTISTHNKNKICYFEFPSIFIPVK